MDDFDATSTQDYGDYDDHNHVHTNDISLMNDTNDSSSAIDVPLPACEICKLSTNQQELYHCNDCRLFNHWKCQGLSADDPNKPETTMSITCSACRDMNMSAPKIDQPITKRKRPSSSITNDPSNQTNHKVTLDVTPVSITSSDSEDSMDEDVNDVLAQVSDAKRRKIVQSKKSHEAESAAAANLATSARKLAQASQSTTPMKPTLARRPSTEEKRKPSSDEKRTSVASIAKVISPVSKAPATIGKSPSSASGPLLVIKKAIGGPNAEKITQAISVFINQHFGPSERRNCLSRLGYAFKNNESLRQRVHDGKVTPEQLCVMSENDLASEEQQRERAEGAKAALQQVVIKETTIAKHTKEGIEYISVHGDKLERVDAFAPSPDDSMPPDQNDEDATDENGDDDYDDHHDHENGLPFLENEDHSADLMKPSSLSSGPLSLPDTPSSSSTPYGTGESVTRRLSAVELSSPPLSVDHILPPSVLEMDAEAASLPPIGSFVPDVNESFDMTSDDGPTDNLFSPALKSETADAFSPTNSSSPANNASQASSNQKPKRTDIVDLSDDTDNSIRPSIVTPSRSSVSPANARIDSLISSDSTSYRPISSSIAARLLSNQLGAHSEWISCFKATKPLQNIAFTGYLMGVAGQANDEESLNAMKALPRTFTINGRGKPETIRTALNDVINGNDRIASLYHLHVSPDDEQQMKQFCDSHEEINRIALADCRRNKIGLFIYVGRYSPRIVDPSVFHPIFSGVASVKQEAQSYYAVVIYWSSKLAGRSSGSKNQAVIPAVPAASTPVAQSLPAGFPAGPSPFFYPFPFFQPPAAPTADGAAPTAAASMQHPYPYQYPYPYPGMPMAPPAASPTVAPPVAAPLPQAPITPVAPVAPSAPAATFQTPSPYPPYNSNPSNTSSNYNSNSSNTNSNYNSNPNTSSYNNHNANQTSHSSAAAQFLSTISRSQQPQQPQQSQQQQQFQNHRPVSPQRGRSPMRHDDMRGRPSNTFSPRSQPRTRPRTPSPPSRGFPSRSSTGQPMPDRGRSRSPRRHFNGPPRSPVRDSPVQGQSPRGYPPPTSQFNRAGPPPRSPPRHHSPARRPSFSPPRSPPRSRPRPFSPNRSPPRQRIDPRMQQQPPSQHRSMSPVRSQQRPMSPVRPPQAFAGSRPPPQNQQQPGQINPDEPLRTSGQIHPSRIGMAPSR